MQKDYYQEWTLNEERFKVSLKRACENFNIQNPENLKFYSQQDEDKYIIQFLIKNKIEDGVFLEIGACNGILYSNTKTLEDYFGFSGILIEPQNEYFKQLKENRPNCETYNCAVSTTCEEYVNFRGTGADAGIEKTLNYSGSLKISPKSLLKSLLGKRNRYQVKNLKMSDILKKSRFEYIDIMIIDVEGGELDVLKTIDFSFPIYCIFIEAHSNQKEKNEEFHKFLIEQGFDFVERQRGNEVWINPGYHRRAHFKL